MGDIHLGQEAEKLYTRIETFINNYEALKKNWDAGSNLPNLPLEEAFKENCNLAVFVGTKDPTANDATYMEEHKAVNAVLARGGNLFEELFKLFKKHAEALVQAFKKCKNISHGAFVKIGDYETQSAGQEGAMLQHVADVKKLLDQLSTAEGDQEKQLAEYLSKAGEANQSYELTKTQKASADQAVEDSRNKIVRLEKEKHELNQKLQDGLASLEMHDFEEHDFEDYGASDTARAGWGAGMNMEIDSKEGDIKFERAALLSKVAHAAAVSKTLQAIEGNKTEREKAIATLKTADAHLKTIQVQLAAIKTNSGDLRQKLQSYVKIFTDCESHVGFILNKAQLFQAPDVAKFDIKTRARLENKVVAVVNEGVYFADQPNVFVLLRQTLGAVEKSNDFSGSEEEVKRLKGNIDLVNQLLTQSQTAIAAGKHGVGLPQPTKLIEAE